VYPQAGAPHPGGLCGRRRAGRSACPENPTRQADTASGLRVQCAADRQADWLNPRTRLGVGFSKAAEQFCPMGILSLLGNRKVQPIHTECDMFRLWLGPCEARRAGRPGATAEAGPGRQAPDQGTEQSGRKPRQGRPSGQHPPLRSFRMLQSRQSQVHKREEVHGGPKAYDPLLTTIFKPQDEASAVAHPHPRGRCQPVMPCLMGSLGGGQKGPSSPTRSVSGRGCWESPPTKGQRLPEVLPGGPPPEEFQPGEAKYWVFFCFFVVVFFFTRLRCCLSQIC